VSDQFGTAGDPLIANNLFRNNRSFSATSYYRASYGGGIQVSATGNYPLISRNVFEGNLAQRDPTVGGIIALGGAGHFRMQREDAVVAENVVRANNATAIDPTAPSLLTFAGFVFGMNPFDDPGEPARAPLVQNNLIVDNLGVGLSVQGLWVDGIDADDPPGGDDIAEPDEIFSHGPRVINNTIANNVGIGVVMNLADEAIFESNIVWGNDPTAAFGVTAIFDNWLCSDGDGVDPCIDRPSAGVTWVSNVVQDFPANQADGFVDPVTMLPVNGNAIGQDPLFLDPTNPDPRLRDYHLQQPPDQAVTSPGVDAGPVGAVARDYATPRNAAGRDVDLDGDDSNDTLFHRTTNAPGGRPDVFFVDAGFHYPLDPANPVVDTDGDGVPDDIEIELAMNDPNYACLDPNDADSDDDGVIDGLDVGGDLDGDLTAAGLRGRGGLVLGAGLGRRDGPARSRQ
jgi:hypothetical protein